MDIEQCRSFISALQIASQNKLYVIQQGHRFTLTHKKENKSLDTQKIVSLAEQFLVEQFRFPVCVQEGEEIGHLIKNLSSVLFLYSKRIGRSKTLYYKILYILGIRSIIEYKCLFIALRISWLQFPNQSDQRIRDQLIIENEKPLSILKSFFQKVLGSAPLHHPILETHSPKLSLFSTLNELKEFQKTLTHSVGASITPIIEELSFASGIQRYYELSNSSKQEVIIAIHERLRQLPALEQLTNQQSYPFFHVVIPGKSSTTVENGKSHSFLNWIWKIKEGNYAFSIVNSGAAAPGTSTEKLNNIKEKNVQLMQNLLLQKREKQSALLQQAIQKQREFEYRGPNITFTDLTLEDFSTDFIQGLLEFNTGEKKSASMGEFLRWIQNRLQKNGGKNMNTNGPHHHFQYHDHCAQQCVFRWLHDRWNENLHRQFKAFIARKWMSKLNNIKAEQIAELNLNYPQINFAEIIWQMKELGRAKTFKRESKCIIPGIVRSADSTQRR